jgi:hypothetical protein
MVCLWHQAAEDGHPLVSWSSGFAGFALTSQELTDLCWLWFRERKLALSVETAKNAGPVRVDFCSQMDQNYV